MSDLTKLNIIFIGFLLTIVSVSFQINYPILDLPFNLWLFGGSLMLINIGMYSLLFLQPTYKENDILDDIKEH